MPVDKNGNWIFDPADIGRWDEKPYINPYEHVEIPPLEEFRANLRSLRYVDLNQYLNNLLTEGGEVITQDVPVDLIIGTSVGQSWDFTDRQRDKNTTPEEYVWNIARALKEGTLRLSVKSETIILTEINGLYFVSLNGRHRIAAMKGMKGENVVAVGVEVNSTKFVKY